MATPTNRVVANLRKRGVTVYHHHQWGSRHRATYALRRVTKRAKRPAGTCVQHITVTNPGGDFKANVRTVERIGYDRFKSGVSYNWVVDMTTGEVAVGQPLDAKGTHTVNNKNVPGYSYDQNYAARAIAVLGMPNTPLSAKAEHAITQILAAMVEEGELTDGFDYDPHSKFTAKDCPCDATRSRMDAIRQKVRDDRKPVARPVPPTNISLARELLEKAAKVNKGTRLARITAALKSLPRR